MEPHPIRLVVTDDLRRSRLTVFFRLFLLIPHAIWLLLWSIAAFFAAVANWVVVLVTGTPSVDLHRFLSALVRYSTHVYAYAFLAANPFPALTGTPGYPIDVQVDPPTRQGRLGAAFRLVLALPPIVLTSVLVGTASWNATGEGGGFDASASAGSAGYFSGVGLGFVVAFLGWFACLARGRMPQGFRDLEAYALRYAAQTYGYFFLLTDRYPSSDPSWPDPAPAPTAPAITLHPDGDDLRRSRLSVFFRLLLTFPHFAWLIVWTVGAFVAVVANWFAVVFTGRSPDRLHRFLSAYLRYEIQVFAYLLLVANPFPGFTGQAGRYPVEIVIAPPEPQSRRTAGFRIFLAVPALLVAGAFNSALLLVAVGGWFASLATGRMPGGLRNLGAYSLRYIAQTDGYVFLLTGRYPYSGPAQLPAPSEDEPTESSASLAA
ncbi:MAG: DUF4389 domain-containing protein [Gaiellaceae bacterium]